MVPGASEDEKGEAPDRQRPGTPPDDVPRQRTRVTGPCRLGTISRLRWIRADHRDAVNASEITQRVTVRQTGTEPNSPPFAAGDTCRRTSGDHRFASLRQRYGRPIKSVSAMRVSACLPAPSFNLDVYDCQ
jgi:hypothetical protein